MIQNWKDRDYWVVQDAWWLLSWSPFKDIYEVYSIRGFREIEKYENKQLSLGFNNEKCMEKLHIVWDGV